MGASHSSLRSAGRSEAADDLWEDDVDEPIGEVTPAHESVEVPVDLVSYPARAVWWPRGSGLAAKVAAPWSAAGVVLTMARGVVHTFDVTAVRMMGSH